MNIFPMPDELLIGKLREHAITSIASDTVYPHAHLSAIAAKRIEDLAEVIESFRQQAAKATTNISSSAKTIQIGGRSHGKTTTEFVFTTKQIIAMLHADNSLQSSVTAERIEELAEINKNHVRRIKHMSKHGEINAHKLAKLQDELNVLGTPASSIHLAKFLAAAIFNTGSNDGAIVHTRIQFKTGEFNNEADNCGLCQDSLETVLTGYISDYFKESGS